MAADKAFPVDEGTKVTLTCKAGFQLQGDNIVTCTKGTEFEHAHGAEPKCGEFFWNVVLILSGSQRRPYFEKQHN